LRAIESTMGLRFKILLTFVLCFGLMAGISLTLLQRSMSASYDALERRDLTAHMGRVQQIMEARVAALNTTTRDWAIWTDMYQFALRPNMEWAKENIGASAMATADLSLLVIYGKDGRLITMTTNNPKGQNLTSAPLENTANSEFFKQQNLQPGCGLMATEAGLMLTCWTHISRSDATGDFVGRLVMGRLIDAPLVKKMGAQVGLPFEVHINATLPTGLTLWPADTKAGPLGKRDFFTAHEPSTYHLYYPLRDIFGREAALVTLAVSRDVHLQSEQLLARVLREQIALALIVGALLFSTIHWMIVRRLRKLELQLLHVAESKTWDRRVDKQGKDELGVLADRINKLLELIQRQWQDLNTLSMTDALTGLPNRRAFDLSLAAEYTREQRNGRPLTLLLIDADQFKKYNDQYGHPLGDLALKSLAGVLQSAIRHEPDLAARIGGEEFAILLPEADEAAGLMVANRIRANMIALNMAHAASTVKPDLTVSIGLAVARDEHLTAFMKRADLALYQAKNEGRDRVQCAP
jgi:diguanylate cyclase (GGDEF)-like protein